MIQFNVFPEGLSRIVTFSYDDGPENDARLVELFNKYGVKGTFHLNSRKYLDKTEEELDAIGKLYEGHEISCHTVHHGWLNRMLPASIISEVMEDRKLLERIAGYPVVGMSYPYGTYDDAAVEAIRACGIVYCRTTLKEHHALELPRNFLTWHPTCHHNEIGQYINSYIKNIDRSWSSPLFYIWGHSYEFDTEEKWEELEGYIARLAEHKDKIWFATNIEIYNYIKAQHSLIVSADEKIIYNPSAITVWVKKDSAVVKIEAGETVRL